MTTNSKAATVLGVILSVLGVLGTTNLVPILGDVLGAKVSAIVAILGAVLAAVSKALFAPAESPK